MAVFSVICPPERREDEETHANDQLLVDGEAQRRMSALLALGAQDRDFELTEFGDALEKLT